MFKSDGEYEIDLINNRNGREDLDKKSRGRPIKNTYKVVRTESFEIGDPDGSEKFLMVKNFLISTDFFKRFKLHDDRKYVESINAKCGGFDIGSLKVFGYVDNVSQGFYQGIKDSNRYSQYSSCQIVKDNGMLRVYRLPFFCQELRGINHTNEFYDKWYNEFKRIKDKQGLYDQAIYNIYNCSPDKIEDLLRRIENE